MMKGFELEYPDKMPQAEILALRPSGRLEEVRSGRRESGIINPNAFYFGDNFPILSLLREEYKNKIDLIYIDPPFGTGRQFAKAEKSVAYEDQEADVQFLEFLRKRLILIRELLSEEGSIYLHIDKKIGHYVKLIMDEVFGYDNFLNDLTRIKCNPKNFSRKAYGNYSDMILFYAKERDRNIWNETKEPLSETEIETLFPKTDPEKGCYTTHPLHAPGPTLDGDTGQPWKGMMPPKGRHWRYQRKKLDELDEAGLIEWSSTGNPRKIVFASDHPGKKVQDVWEYKDRGLSYVSYPTEKNHDLLARIIAHSSRPDSLVLDAFAGSGSTLMVASALGRKWIGMDETPESYRVVMDNLSKAGIEATFYEYIAG